jgi:hypothetical protein
MIEVKDEMPASANAKAASSFGKTLSFGLRRCHLYLGLFLAPWALLYGITGYLFNHPTHFSDRGLKEISRAELMQSGFDGSLADPMEAATEVIDKLNERFPDAKLELAKESEAKYVGDFFFATATGTNKTYQLLIRRDGGGGTYLDSTVPPKPAHPTAEFIVNPRGGNSGGIVMEKTTGDGAKPAPLTITRGAAAKVEAILEELAKKLETPDLDQPFRLTSAPQLQFRAISRGDTWTVKYDSFQGAVSAEWFDAGSRKEPMSWRSYLLHLHTTHGYSGIYEARWFWAMIVDLMSFVMVFWAISGFLMWWQIKRLRTSGWVVIALSLFVAVMLFWAMV